MAYEHTLITVPVDSLSLGYQDRAGDMDKVAATLRKNKLHPDVIALTRKVLAHPLSPAMDAARQLSACFGAFGHKPGIEPLKRPVEKGNADNPYKARPGFLAQFDDAKLDTRAGARRKPDTILLLTGDWEADTITSVPSSTSNLGVVKSGEPEWAEFDRPWMRDRESLPKLRYPVIMNWTFYPKTSR
jgi:hypothetical protein